MTVLSTWLRTRKLFSTFWKNRRPFPATHYFSCIDRLQSIRSRTAVSENTCRGCGKEDSSGRSATGPEGTTKSSRVKEVFEAKVECDLSVEALFSYLAELSAPGFKVWLHDKKAYAIFTVSSLDSLRKLAETIEQRGRNCKFLRIVEV